MKGAERCEARGNEQSTASDPCGGERARRGRPQSVWSAYVLLHPIKEIVLLAIKGYRATKPFRMDRCRFYPSCSAYAQTAIKTHGLLFGTILAAWRLVKCQPLHSGGIDEVPVQLKWECK